MPLRIPPTMRGTDGAALASVWTAALAAILGNFTALIIGYLDNANLGTIPDISTLDATEIARLSTIQTQTDKSAGSEGAATFSYLDAGGEQVIFTIATSTRKKLHSIFIDLATLTQNTTIRLKHKIDGSTYRTFETIAWTTAEDDGVYFNKNLAINQDLQVTMEEAVDEGAARAIPYYYIAEDME